jgi:ribonuclease P protein component
MRNSLSRPESLKSHKLIRLLFNKGESFFSFPFRIVFMEQESTNSVPVQFLISVGKKKIKTAVKRNHIKRLFRESYRTQKHELFDLMKTRNRQLLVAFVFVGEEKTDFIQMKEKTKVALNMITKKLIKSA